MRINLRPPSRFLMTSALLAVLIAGLHSPAAAEPIDTTWSGGGASDEWEDVANWSIAGFPDNGQPNPDDIYNALIPATSGTVNQNIATGALGLPGVVLNDFTLRGGTLTGGDVTVVSTFTWSGGTMSGAGVTTVAEGSTGQFVASAFGKILHREVVNEGTLNWAHGLHFSSAGSVSNSPGGTIEASLTDSSAAAINNLGTFTRGGNDGTSTFTKAFDNTGTVNVDQGMLSLNGGGISTGAFNIAADAVVRIGGGTHDLSNSSSSGAGTMLLFSGTLEFDDGDAAFGTLLSQTSVTTLTGSSDLLLTSGLSWSGGTMSGTGVTVIAGGSTGEFIGGAFGKILDREIVNQGTLDWAHGLHFSSSGIVTNATGGTVDLSLSGGTGGIVDNAGTLVRAGNAGTSTFSQSFHNTGTVSVDEGTLTLNNSYTQTDGVLRLAGGNIIKNGAALDIDGGSLEGNGTITGSANLAEAMLSPGDSTGTLAISANLLMTSATQSVFEIAGGSDFDVVTVGGTATLDGLLHIDLLDGFTPEASDTFTIFTVAGALTGTFDNGIDTIATIGGGTFDITYGDDAVTLSNYIPEPGALGLMIGGLPLLLRRRYGGTSRLHLR